MQEAGKPVVVSMGGVAASGGYYVSAGADAILAEPGTLTGSIGVFGGKFSTAELMGDLGVNTTPITRGRNADLYTAARPWDEVQRAAVQEQIDATYRRFKKLVSDGRGLTMDEVEEVARGRVWTGRRAVENGLVDALGGFQDAVLQARDLAGIHPRRKVGLVSYSESGSLLEELAPSFVSRVLGPADEALARARTRATAERLRAHAMAFEALAAAIPESASVAALLAAHPETSTWMMDPWLVTPRTR